MQLAGKLGCPGRLAAVAAGLLVHIVDELTGRRFLVDTGASYSIWPYSSTSSADGPRLFGPAGQLIQCWGERKMQLQFQGTKFSWPFLLAAVDFPIIGVDFLKQHSLMVDPANNRLVSAQGKTFPTMAQPSPPTASVVTGLHLQHTATPLPVSAPQPQTTPAQLSRPASNYEALLADFPEVVNASKRLPAVHHDVVHHIVTTGPPVSAKFRRLDGEKLAAAKAEFKQLQEDGIIQRSTSPWSSPLHMVRKQDGSWRPCGDFRRLNLVTEPDVYPLPNMLDFAVKAAGCKVFSKIDLRKGYHQIPVNPADIPKTAITTPFGLFEYKRLPFGLRNAASTFQRHIDRAVEEVDAAFAFADDILVCSVDHVAHLQHLRQLFSALSKHSLVINAEKCVWGVESIDFLGHRVSAQGVQPLPSHVAAVQDFPRPETVKELQAFLGMVNFYRRFLPAIAKTLRPLTDSLRGGPKGSSSVLWTPECAEAFASAKAALLRATCLAHPTTGSGLNLAVDASSTHVGATLQQQESGSDTCRPLGFFSKKLDPAQQKYSAFDRELFAVYAGIRHFRHLLEGRKFTVYTDHKPLTHAISRVSDPWTARQCRHLAYIAEYTSDIRHVAGAENIVADTLSRPPGHVPRVSSPSFPAGGLSAGNGQRATSTPSRPGPQLPTPSPVDLVATPPAGATLATLVSATPLPGMNFADMARKQLTCPVTLQQRDSSCLQVQEVDV